MKDIVTWCVQHMPGDISKVDIFASLDACADIYYKKVILRNTRYDTTDLELLTISDIASETPYEQYLALLGKLFSVGIKNIPVDQICKFITWMLDIPKVYDSGFISWVYYNSALNDKLNYPAHAVVCEMLPEGCGRAALDFLFRAACQSDPTVINTLRVIHKCTGTKWYLPLITYFYLCSGIDEECLNYFFSDVHRLSESDAELCLYITTLYVWSDYLITELIRRNYTIKSALSVLKKVGVVGIHEPNVQPKLYYFHKRISKHVHYSEFKYIKDLPEIPAGYILNQGLWNEDIKFNSEGITLVTPSKIYAAWFAGLTDKQKEHLKELNIDVYTKCKQGNFNEVAIVLNTLMYNFT